MRTIRLLIILLVSWFPLGAFAQLEGEWVSFLLHRLVFQSDSVTINRPDHHIYPNKFRYVIQDSIIEFQLIEDQRRIDSTGSSRHLDTSRYRYQFSYRDSTQFRLINISSRNILAYQMDTLYFSRPEVQQRVNLSGNFSLEYSYSNPWARGKYDNFHLLITESRHCFLFVYKPIHLDSTTVFVNTCQQAQLSQAQYDKLREELNQAQVYRWPYRTNVPIDGDVTELFVHDSRERIAYFYGCFTPYTAQPLYRYLQELRRNLHFQRVDYVVLSNFDNHSWWSKDSEPYSIQNRFFWQMLRNNPYE